MTVAKIVKTGASQSIRLPKEFLVEADQVFLKKTKTGFLVLPGDPWALFEEGVRELSDSFMESGRDQSKTQPRPWD